MLVNRTGRDVEGIDLFEWAILDLTWERVGCI
jgi:hypothetical protein